MTSEEGLIDQLTKLSKLLAEQSISDEEFKILKARLLSEQARRQEGIQLDEHRSTNQSSSYPESNPAEQAGILSVNLLSPTSCSFSGPYAQALETARAAITESGGEIVEDSSAQGFIEGKFRFAINRSGLRVRWEFRDSLDGRIAIETHGRFVDAPDLYGNAQRRAVKQMEKFTQILTTRSAVIVGQREGSPSTYPPTLPNSSATRPPILVKSVKAKTWTWLLWVLSVPAIILFVAGNMDTTAGIVGLYLILSVIGILLFVIPSYIGFKRDVEGKWLLFFANVILGATGVVWIACIVYACLGPKRISDSYDGPIDRDR
jgi:hypothetical protein